MKRREFIAGLAGAAAWPLGASAQQVAKVIGYLSGATRAAESQRGAAFVQRLRELGWTDGRTIAIQARWAEGHTEQFAEIAVEFPRQKLDIIVATGTPPALAAKQATSVIPIVVAVADPRGTVPQCELPAHRQACGQSDHLRFNCQRRGRLTSHI